MAVDVSLRSRRLAMWICFCALPILPISFLALVSVSMVVLDGVWRTWSVVLAIIFVAVTLFLFTQSVWFGGAHIAGAVGLVALAILWSWRVRSVSRQLDD